MQSCRDFVTISFFAYRSSMCCISAGRFGFAKSVRRRLGVEAESAEKRHDVPSQLALVPIEVVAILGDVAPADLAAVRLLRVEHADNVRLRRHRLLVFTC